MREVNAVVLENKRIAENVFSLTVSTDDEIPIRPGQFAMLGAGEHVLRRPIAVCKAEGERVTFCYQVKGAGTRYLSQNYRAGERIPVLLPLGNGFFVGERETRIAVVGGGVGVFPLISLIRACAGRKEIFSYMGFRNKAALCMEYEMQRSDKLTIATDDGSAGFHGTAVQAFMQDIEEIRPDAVFSCGPVPMLRALKNAVAGRGIPVYVSLEERMGCGVGACLVCVCDLTDGRHARVCKDGPVFGIGEVEL